MATVSSPSTSLASASLYVGDLAPDVTEALLFEIFNAVGPVASVRVCRDAATRRSLGYAYVNFHRLDDAERALDTLNFKQIKGKACRIMWCNRDPSLRKSGVGNIFVNGLAKSIDNKQLYDTFSVFGNILSCKVSLSGKAESLGYGFVHFESEESATSAIDKVNGKVIGGQQVTVAVFKSKKERGGGNKSVYTNVFVKNLPGEFVKDDLDKLFSQHGTITSSVCIQDKTNKARAFGFINFATAEDAKQAVDALNNLDIDGRKLYVGRAQKKDERERELRERFEQAKLERQKKYAGVNLYVKNLADDLDDEKLRQEFSKFGSITSAKTMRDSNGNSKGFGFVCFSSPEEATKCVSDMNNKMLSGKPLYVALAQRKDQRRAMLEQQYTARMKMGMMPPMPQMYPGPQGPNGPLLFPKFPQAPQPMMYAQPMMAGPRRWQPAGPQPMVGRPVQFGLVAVNGGRPGPQPMMNGMPGQPGPRGPRQQRRGVPKGQHGEQGIKYADNVRNRQPPAQAQPQAVPAAVPQPIALKPGEPLSLQMLAAATEEMRKQLIGERLFPLVHAQQPDLAGKITGMLLEMDNGELLHLLESEQALVEKIQEAILVLESHSDDADAESS